MDQPQRLGHGNLAHLAIRQRHTAGDKRGCGGTELWIKSDLGIRLEDPIVLYATPRALLVDGIAVAGQLVDALVLHAPCEPKNDAQRAAVSEWWAEIQREVDARKHPGRPLLCFIDNNGPVGSVLSTAVGSVGADDQTYNGARLHEFLLRNRLVLPATFYGDGAPTWLSTAGTWRRIDYVAYPLEWLEATCVRGTRAT